MVSSIRYLISHGTSITGFSAAVVAPTMKDHYRVSISNTSSNLTLLRAQLQDGKMPNPGKYRCVNNNDSKEKKYLVTVVNHLKCGYLPLL